MCSTARELQLQERAVSYLNGDQIDVMTRPKLDNIAYWMNVGRNSPSNYARQLSIRAPVRRFDYHSGLYQIGNDNPYDARIKPTYGPVVKESELVMQMYKNRKQSVIPKRTKKEMKFYRMRFPERSY
jgi:hypothetical protein